eukprot:TRINITY_DN103708_c0_g1_i1.p1 TRINITY_DN103708_c0_g1~~TRINITY_DN103708_c0_g1_i1.p1  ORF type:complete len:188 (+),score=40.38 TRINITY_DN103708_c0_g1_i1:153-716(+)
MQKHKDLDFNVRWLPFQLNSNAPAQTSKLEMYMKKFGMTKEDAMQRSEMMRQKFAAAGLPFSFKETDLTGNTFDAHRLLTAAYAKGGAAAQDKVSEMLFQSYFAEGRAPSDPEVLKTAAAAIGLDGEAFVADHTKSAAETNQEMEIGRRMGVSGVPHFVIKAEGASKSQELSGAQPPEYFDAVFKQL